MEETPFIEALNAFLEANYSDVNLTVDEICKQLFVSRSKLHRLIKEQSNMTTTEFINKYRIKKSLKLIDKYIAINKVANLCGFNNPKYFTKVFKKYYGVCPSHYTLNKSLVNHY